jgi:GT2 family glycosyltransferase
MPSATQKPLVSVIILNWNSQKFIRACLDSLAEQTYPNLETIILDNASTDNSDDLIEQNYPDVKLIRSKENLGFCRGNNVAAIEAKGDYLFFLNQDVVLEPDYIEKQVTILKKDPKIAAVQGKLLRYDFSKMEKLETIDSAGIAAYRNRRFIDIGQTEEDAPKFNQEGEVFAVTGAALFARKTALAEIAPTGEYFDEDFFAYKEDIDLCWRLRNLGWSCYYQPSAVAYHGRTSAKAPSGSLKSVIKHQLKKPEYVRKLSPRNQLMMQLKNETNGTYWPDFFPMAKRELVYAGFTLFYTPKLLCTYCSFLAHIPKMLKKRHYIMKRRREKGVTSKEIRRWIE